MRNLVMILGIPVDVLDLPQALDRIHQMVKIGRATGKHHQIATVNVDFLVQAQFDPELRYLLQQADMLTADGMPLVWASGWLGAPMKGRVAGADLVPALAHYAAEHGLSLYLLGGMPGVADKAARILKEQSPNLCIAGIYSPPFSSLLEMETTFHQQIRAARPDILLVAFGNPKQEKWIGMYGSSLGVPVLMGVGGSLDFIAGQTRRAPRWMQNAGLEWIYRLIQEPRRLFKRYARDLAIFGVSLLRQLWAARVKLHARPWPLALSLESLDGLPVLSVSGPLTCRHLAEFDQAAQQALAASPRLLINLACATELDSSACGAILHLSNQARAAGGELSLAALPRRIRRTLHLLRLDRCIPIYPHVQTYLASRAASSTAWSASLTAYPVGSRTWNVMKCGRALDAVTSPYLLESASSALQINPFLICDLSETVFIASAGLKALAQLRALASSQQGELRVVGCSADVQQVIQMAHLDLVLPLYNTYAQAAA